LGVGLSERSFADGRPRRAVRWVPLRRDCSLNSGMPLSGGQGDRKSGIRSAQLALLSPGSPCGLRRRPACPRRRALDGWLGGVGPLDVRRTCRACVCCACVAPELRLCWRRVRLQCPCAHAAGSRCGRMLPGQPAGLAWEYHGSHPANQRRMCRASVGWSLLRLSRPVCWSAMRLCCVCVRCVCVGLCCVCVASVLRLRCACVPPALRLCCVRVGGERAHIYPPGGPVAARCGAGPRRAGCQWHPGQPPPPPGRIAQDSPSGTAARPNQPTRPSSPPCPRSRWVGSISDGAGACSVRARMQPGRHRSRRCACVASVLETSAPAVSVRACSRVAIGHGVAPVLRLSWRRVRLRCPCAHAAGSRRGRMLPGQPAGLAWEHDGSHPAITGARRVRVNRVLVRRQLGPVTGGVPGAGSWGVS
jgi:hypothetical protein